MAEPKTLIQAIQYFSDEQVCIETIAAMRWPDGKQECPFCHVKDAHYYLKVQKRWKCRVCRKQFSVKVHTIFEDSPIPLTKWLPALWQLVACKNGISSHELGKALGITQKSAWFVLHRLRLALKSNTGTKLGSNDGGEVEVDETFIGGKAKNMHKDRRLRIHQLRSEYRNGEFPGKLPGKTVVQGILDREARQIRATVMHNVKRETLQNEVLKNVKYGSRVYTDSAVAYDNLNWRYIHEVVNHAECYVRGQVHTNGLENFWSLLKRNLSGTYVAVEPFHLDRYLDEQVFRYNNRGNRENKVTDFDRFDMIVRKIVGKRLTFAALTGKTADATCF